MSRDCLGEEGGNYQNPVHSPSKILKEDLCFSKPALPLNNRARQDLQSARLPLAGANLQAVKEPLKLGCTR